MQFADMRRLEADRPAFEAMFQDYVQQRLSRAIRVKLAGKLGLLAEFDATLSELRACRGAASYELLERGILYGFFSPKAALMCEFDEKVKTLERAIAPSTGQVV